jgi:hypothetical protein
LLSPLAVNILNPAQRRISNATRASKPSTQLTILLIPQISTGVSAPQEEPDLTLIPDVSVCGPNGVSHIPCPLALPLFCANAGTILNSAAKPARSDQKINFFIGIE